MLPRRAMLLAAALSWGSLTGDALTAHAAPPRSSRNARTATPQTKPPAAKTPAPAKTAPQTAKPIPPQPKREADAAPTSKAPVSQAPAVMQEPAAANAPTSAAVRPRTTELFAPPPVAATTDKNEKYLLRYQFAKGETVRWLVEHRAKIASTVEGSSQTAETSTMSVKAWKVVETFPGGETKFINSVESIDMRQKLTGRQETTYNSRIDKEVPPMFAAAAKQVGQPLAEVTIDGRGNVQKRLDLKKADTDGAPQETSTSDITLVLPDKPLGIGESWTAPLDLSATDEKGGRIVIKARRKITLLNVTGNVATLRHETQILSPLNDPKIEAQVVQSEQAGDVMFDLARGRIIKLSLANDREVFGFQGDASVMHVEAAFIERLADTAGTPIPEAAEPKAKTAAANTDAVSPSARRTTEASSQAPTIRPATDDDKTAERPTTTKSK
ncbi:MAG: hypothetical protein C0483_20590 [Pirellula sp.]|nr:hypothetical protein [Pirellula sp.]